MKDSYMEVLILTEVHKYRQKCKLCGKKGTITIKRVLLRTARVECNNCPGIFYSVWRPKKKKVNLVGDTK